MQTIRALIKLSASFALACVLAPACGKLKARPGVDAASVEDAATPDATTPDAPDAATGDGRPAFPGAVGWGGTTPGGRGGQLLRVTTLAATGPGSLAAALGTPGPRVIVFEVGGVIDLNGARLNVVIPYVTIAGQTAPGPGITIIRGGVVIQTHDVILRHIRVRPGEAGRAKMSGWEPDSISTYAAHHVIVDHCSTSWGIDENLSASGERFLGATAADWRAATSHAITFSHDIVAEGLSNSTHSEGEHSKGGLIHDNVTDMAVYANLYFSNRERHPLFKGGARGVVVNNYIANPGKYAIMYALVADEWTGHPYEEGWMSIVGNVLTYGPSTPAGTPLLRVSGAGRVLVYLEDNLARTAAGADATQVGGTLAFAAMVPARPTWPDGLTAMPAAAVADDIRASAGARPWNRDAIDARIVDQALAGQGAIISSETEGGGYPTVEEVRAPFVEDDWDLTYVEPKSGVYP